jgi:Fe-S-cluster containining protein
MARSKKTPPEKTSWKAVRAERAARARKGKGKPPPTDLAECNDCPALCCHDLVMPIEKPKTDKDVFELKWELQYDTICVFVRSYRWYRLIKGRCQYLDDHNRCTIYEQRPRRCRQHNPPDCEYYGEFYDHMITTPEELDEHLGRD